jgi:signal transduction histidine kinase
MEVEREEEELFGVPEPEARPDGGPEGEEERKKQTPTEASELSTQSIVTPLADEIRGPVLALRAYAGLLNQRPDDPGVRNRLSTLLEGDLQRIEGALQRVERFCAFGAADLKPVDLAGLLTTALQRRIQTVRERGLVVLEEPDREAPPATADEEQLRFAIDSILDRAMRMVPKGGDLYVGSRFVLESEDQAARHRILIRFHCPEEVLAPPDEAAAGGTPLEVLLARSLIERVGGSLSVDVSGPHDNLVLIEIPS